MNTLIVSPMAIANNIALTTPRLRKPVMIGPGVSFLAGIVLTWIIAALVL